MVPLGSDSLIRAEEGDIDVLADQSSCDITGMLSVTGMLEEDMIEIGFQPASAAALPLPSANYPPLTHGNSQPISGISTKHQFVPPLHKGPYDQSMIVPQVEISQQAQEAPAIAQQCKASGSNGNPSMIVSAPISGIMPRSLDVEFSSTSVSHAQTGQIVNAQGPGIPLLQSLLISNIPLETL